MILQVLLINFMSKMRTCEAVFNIKFIWGRWGGYFSVFVHTCHCLIHNLVDALEVNPDTAHPPGAKAGHCTSQIHFWSYWINTFASVCVLVKINCIRSQEIQCFQIICVLKITIGVLKYVFCYYTCHLVSNVCTSPVMCLHTNFIRRKG